MSTLIYGASEPSEDFQGHAKPINSNGDERQLVDAIDSMDDIFRLMAGHLEIMVMENNQEYGRRALVALSDLEGKVRAFIRKFNTK